MEPLSERFRLLERFIGILFFACLAFGVWIIASVAISLWNMGTSSDPCAAVPQRTVTEFTRIDPSVGVWTDDYGVYGYSSQEDSIIYQYQECVR